jgi:DNA repair exonuclease SbcCD ATPase subunit
LEKLAIAYTRLTQIDIDSELQAHKDLSMFVRKQTELQQINSDIARLETIISKELKNINKLRTEIGKLQDHKCYACGQDFHDEQHNKVLTDKQNQLKVRSYNS